MTVFTVPIGLTEFQRDLIEILLSIHHETLLKELGITPSSSNSITSSSDANALTSKAHVQIGTHYPTFTSRQMLYLLDTHIRAVTNHPCLLVDHYMPRQFLRMEPKQRLIDPSNKFYFLQKLLFELVNYQSKDFGPLSITLVAHSMKELDLIEGLLLGQNFNLKRLSGTTLYDEKTVYSRGNQVNTNLSSSSSLSSSSITTSTSTSTSSSASSIVSSSYTSTSSSSLYTNTISDSNQINSNLNRYTGYFKDNYYYTNKNKNNNNSYNKKRKLENDNGMKRNWIFLATTKHLIHDEDLLRRYDTNLIIAFDPMINDTMPCLNIPIIEQQSQTRANGRLRRSNGTVHQQKRQKQKIQSYKKIPIIKLLVMDSPDHYILDRNLNNEQDVDAEYDNIKKSLVYFFKNREHIGIEHRGNNVDFSQLITQALASVNDSSIQGTQLSLSDHVNVAQKEISPDWFHPQFQKNYNSALTSLDVSLHQFNVRNYQFELMRKTLTRLNEINSIYDLNNNILIDKRLKETERQNLLDSLKKSIGGNFKTFQSREKLKNDTEKSLESVVTENAKIKIIYNNLKGKYDELNMVFQEIVEDKDLLNKKVIEYETKNNRLKSRLDDLLEINKKKTEDEDELRSIYQTDSNTAANKSLELKNWEKSEQFLEEKQKNAQWAELSYNSLLSSKYDLEREIQQMKKTNQFLKNYIETITELNFKSTSQNNSEFVEGNKKMHTNMSKNKKSRISSSVSSNLVNVVFTSSSSTTSASITTKNSSPESRIRLTRSNSPNYT